jgi:hypothetical protein
VISRFLGKNYPEDCEGMGAEGDGDGHLSLPAGTGRTPMIPVANPTINVIVLVAIEVR